jgi:hypothetical protein
MDSYLDRTLALDALGMALRTRRPEAGLVHHSDRGVQYASEDYRSRLRERGIICSMSRKGDCWDNAVAESFFSTLKAELVHRNDYVSRSQARASIFEYIEAFYNGRRRHSALGYVRSVEHEIAAARHGDAVALGEGGVSSKLGRPLVVRGGAVAPGHPGTSPERGGPVFLSRPLLHERRSGRWLLTLTLRGKAMDGFEEQQERNRPQLSPPSLGNRRTDAGFPQASTGRRRSVAGRSLGLSLPQRTEHTIDRSQTLATQATRPLDRGRSRARARKSERS